MILTFKSMCEQRYWSLMLSVRHDLDIKCLELVMIFGMRFFHDLDIHFHVWTMILTSNAEDRPCFWYPMLSLSHELSIQFCDIDIQCHTLAVILTSNAEPWSLHLMLTVHYLDIECRAWAIILHLLYRWVQAMVLTSNTKPLFQAANALCTWQGIGSIMIN